MTHPLTSAAERPLSRDELLALKNKRTLVTAFQLSWILAFVCLVVVCLQIRGTAGPLPTLTPVQFLVPLAATLGISISGWTAWQGLKAIRVENNDRFMRMWSFTLALGAGFLAIVLVLFSFNPYSGQYESIFRVMIGYHAVHAAIIGGWLAQVFLNARRGTYTARDHWGVEAGARLWYFVIAAWVLFYVVLYLI